MCPSIKNPKKSWCAVKYRIQLTAEVFIHDGPPEMLMFIPSGEAIIATVKRTVKTEDLGDVELGKLLSDLYTLPDRISTPPPPEHPHQCRYTHIHIDPGACECKCGKTW